MYNNELYHHGRLGQKWGKRNGPPYPLTGRGLSAYRQRRKAKKAEKLEKKQAKTETEEETKARRDAERERVLREGSATEVFQFRNELSNQELSNALNRIKWTNELARLAAEEADKGWKSIDQVMKKVGNVKDWTRTGVDFYKTLNEAIELANKKK